MLLKFKKYFKWLHFFAISILIINALIKNLTKYSLLASVELGLELIVFISGLLLFFLYFKPFKKINLYFLIYPFFSILLFIGFLFKSILILFLFFIIFSPFIPDNQDYKKNDIIISTYNSGFLSHCCSYKIKERKCFIFTKECGRIEVNRGGVIDFKTLKIKANKDNIFLSFQTMSLNSKREEKVIKR